MKRNKILFFSAMLALGFAIACLPNASAQETNSASTNTPPPVKEPPAAEVEPILAEALKAVFPGAQMTEFKKQKNVGTNFVYAINATGKIEAWIALDGIVVETEEPANINTFPPAANEAVRKAITGMGIKDNGCRLRKTYAVPQKNEAGQDALVKLPAPELTYGADVANNHGAGGKFGFKANGTLVQKPDWAP